MRDVEEEEGEEVKVFQPHMIKEAITFRPTLDEFNDPLEYIKKIRHIGEQYGVCKIKPPASWRPSFCLDLKTFKFTPRVQRLNELEAGTRIKLQFLDKLSKFWELQGNNFKIPIVERKPLDIYLLYKTVHAMGGYENVVRNRRWTRVREEVGLKEASTVHVLKAHYEKLLYPYILFEAGVTTSTTTATATCVSDEKEESHREETRKGKRAAGRVSGAGKASRKQKEARKSFAYDPEDIEKINCRRCSRGDDEEFILLCDECDESFHTYCLYPPLKEIPKGDWRCPDCVAEICKRPTDSYGFEQSKRQYSLAEFGEMAHKFKAQHFRKPHSSVEPDEVELEFWRILSSPNDAIEVEYGADLHTLETGSGFPSLRHHPQHSRDRASMSESFDEYLKSPWNLNNLALEEKSVLSQMNVDISGMKIPWAYVGMCFSCFCWHVEDHWSYSINYLHWGDTKTWYGVSAQHADKFEEVMKKNASELFEKSPDLLHHLVTIMNPNLLVQNGVPIYRVNQNEGEFVITFPRAYHAGFNHGFNFAEAVNFCPADWLPIGRAAVDHYKQVKRNTVFSHDELVCKLATSAEPVDIDTLVATEREFVRIIEFENKNRKELLSSNISKIEITYFELLSDDERTCDYCRTTCFVSALTCSCNPKKLVCLNHREHLCDHSLNSRSKTHHFTPLFRYTMEEIHAIHAKLKSRTGRYELWRSNVEAILKARSGVKSAKKKFRLKHLLNLIEEAQMNKYTTSAVGARKAAGRVKQEPLLAAGQGRLDADRLYVELKAEYEQSLKLGRMCEVFIRYYKNDFNTSKVSLSLRGDEAETDQSAEEGAHEDDQDAGDDDEIIYVGKTASAKTRKHMSLQQIKTQMTALQQLVSELPEAEPFMSLFAEVLENEKTLDRLVHEWNVDSLPQLKRAVDYLDRICVQFPAELVDNVRRMHAQAEWLHSARQAVRDPSRLTLAELKSLIDRAAKNDLLIRLPKHSASTGQLERIFSDITHLYSYADSWDKKINGLLHSKSSCDLGQLEKTLTDARKIPVSLDSVRALEKCVATAKQINGTIVQISKSPRKKAHLNDLLETVKLASELPVKLKKMQEIETKIDLATNWVHGLCAMFLKSAPSADSWTAQDHAALVELLTPRQDLAPVVTKLKAACAHAFPLPPEAGKGCSLTPTSAQKRARASKGESPTLLDQSAASDDDRTLSALKSKWQALQYRELDHIKQLRALNREKLRYVVSELSQAESTSAQLPLDTAAAEAEVAVVTGPNENGGGGGGVVNTKVKLSSLPAFCLKCCSCFKSMLASLQSGNFNQCTLCLGLYHRHGCKNSARRIASQDVDADELTISLCSSCERSKRPDVMAVYEHLVSLERLDLSSNESYTFQLFASRYQVWQERVVSMLSSAFGINGARQLRSLTRDLSQSSSANRLDEFGQLYSSIPAVKKAELNELYLEGLVQEAQSDELVLLNKIVTLAGRMVEGGDLCDQLRAKLSKKCEGVLVSSANGREKSLTTKKSAKPPKPPHKCAKKNGAKELAKKSKKAKLIKSLKKPRSAHLDSELRSSIEGANRSEIYDDHEHDHDPDPDPDDDGNENEEEEEQDENEEEAAQSSSEEENDDEDNSSEEVCAVEKCLRPTGSIKWVQCDGGCNRWFHLACVGRTRIGKKENYWCATCTEANKKGDAANEDSQQSNSSLAKRARSSNQNEPNKRFKETNAASAEADNPPINNRLLPVVQTQ